jgi:DNA mismatch repair ATPase MutS
MKVYLMYRDRDFDPERKLPMNEAALTQDLELNTLFNAMAQGDQYLFTVAKTALFTSLNDPEAIRYRQSVLADCLDQPVVVRQIYDLTVEALDAQRKIWGFWEKSADSILHHALQVLEVLTTYLKNLRKIANDNAERFHSEGFTRLFAMLAHDLSDDYFETIAEHLRELKFRRGVLISARLGVGNKGANYILLRPRIMRWRDWLPLVSTDGRSGYTFHIAERDESGSQALANLRGRGINLVANALEQSTDHILSFFRVLRAELAFYVGCLNLHARLRAKGEPVCTPVPLAMDASMLSAEGLYDVCLSLRIGQRAVGNALHADHKSLVVITGANQGGKSTFLRSVGVAQLMMQSGMFVPAASFRANVCDGVFTHYKREEDASMKSGKLDEELSRMSIIADTITPHALLLCNESFAATNDREGSEIARQVVRALIEADVKVFFVTHLFDFAHGFYAQGLDMALFLRAERQPDGQRTFRLFEGEPLPTSYGEDSYQRIFGSVSLLPDDADMVDANPQQL